MKKLLLITMTCASPQIQPIKLNKYTLNNGDKKILKQMNLSDHNEQQHIKYIKFAKSLKNEPQEFQERLKKCLNRPEIGKKMDTYYHNKDLIKAIIEMCNKSTPGNAAIIQAILYLHMFNECLPELEQEFEQAKEYRKIASDIRESYQLPEESKDIIDHCLKGQGQS